MPITFDAAVPPAGGLSTDNPLSDFALLKATCPTCGKPVLGGTSRSCESCRKGCVPGQNGCELIEANTALGRFMGQVYIALCCPDPCYRPGWVPEANAGFFLDYARPRTTTRFRVESGWDLLTPDRAEFFWARADGKGRGPKFVAPKPRPRTPSHPTLPSPSPPGRPPGIGRPAGALVGVPAGRPPGLGTPASTGNSHATTRPVPLFGTGLDYTQLSLYTEAAADRASFFIEMPYRSWSAYDGLVGVGFSDLNLGTKAIMFDSELLLLTFQFKTFLPTASVRNGLGTGHVSLEPSLLASLKLSDSCYLQGQVAEWVPIGGDTNFQGALIHYHLSLNQDIWRIAPDAPLIATLEFNGWSFQTGQYTGPDGDRSARGDSYFSAGPGLRMVLGPNFDFGIGSAFALSEPHWANQMLRFELRRMF